MASYTDLWDLQSNDLFKKRVSFALAVAASSIMGEAQDGDRKVWARKVFSGSLQTPFQLIVLRVTLHSAIMADGAAAPDINVQLALNTIVNDLIALG